RAALTGLVPVADVGVGARCPVGERRELASRGRVAGVGRTRVPVVAGERRAARAGTGLAGFRAVAGVAVAARGAIGEGGVLAAVHGVAAVRGAGVAVVAVRRQAGQ